MHVFSFQAVGFVFTPTDKEKSDRMLHIRYSASKDQYCRVSNGSEMIQSWSQCAWSTESIFRKVEHDWQMVCLFLFYSSVVIFYLYSLYMYHFQALSEQMLVSCSKWTVPNLC